MRLITFPFFCNIKNILFARESLSMNVQIEISRKKLLLNILFYDIIG